MEFTKDIIKSCRMNAVFLDEPACSVFNLALDEIERLQELVDKLKKDNDSDRVWYQGFKCGQESTR